MSFTQQKLSELAVSIPGSTKLFREYDLDFCCGGSVLLEVAAQQKNLNLAEIESRLAELVKHKNENTEKIGRTRLMQKLLITLFRVFMTATASNCPNSSRWLKK